jgi:Na+/proline symporter
MFPSWFVGIADSAIVIGALVPAAIMSIAAADLFTRNIYKEFFRPAARPAHQIWVARFVSLIVKAGVLIFALALSKKFPINLQLRGGIWILQTFPAIVAGLYNLLVPPVGTAARLGRGNGVRHDPGLPGAGPRPGQCAFRRVHGPGIRAPHVHRGSSLCH